MNILKQKYLKSHIALFMLFFYSLHLELQLILTYAKIINQRLIC